LLYQLSYLAKKEGVSYWPGCGLSTDPPDFRERGLRRGTFNGAVICFLTAPLDDLMTFPLKNVHPRKYLAHGFRELAFQ
jgi:hypothetical protein